METLNQFRKRAAKLPLKELASRAGYSRGYVCDLINGEKKNPSLVAFERLVKAADSIEQDRNNKLFHNKTTVLKRKPRYTGKASVRGGKA